MSIKRSAVRFCVADDIHRASSWACIGEEDGSTYLICRELGRAWKVSLHPTGIWRAAYLESFLEAEREQGLLTLPGRTIDEWTRPSEFFPGLTMACQLFVPPAALNRSLMSLTPAAIRIPPSGDARWTEIDLLISTPEMRLKHDSWPGETGMSAQLIGTFATSTGETVWVVSHYRPPIELCKSKANPRPFSRAFDEIPHNATHSAMVFTVAEDETRGFIEYHVPRPAVDAIVDRARQMRN